MKPRPYQSKAELAVIEAWKEFISALVVMPTGTGKTVLFASLILWVIKNMTPGRVLVVAHRKELVWQARDKIRKVTGLSVEIEMGEYKSRTEGDLLNQKPKIVVCTIQTLTAGGDGAGRIGKFNPEEFSAVIVDEAHHATSPSYKKALDYFKTNPKLKILGVTATPNRADEEALGQIFDTVAFDYEMWSLDPNEPCAIRDGWLVPVVVKPIYVSDLDFTDIRTTAGDLNQADLDAVLRAEKPVHRWVQAIVETMFSLEENSLGKIDTKEWSNFIGDRKFKRVLAFASSVAHASLLCDILNRIRAGLSAFVSGGTDPDERIKINADYAAGKFAVLCNCGTHTEGFDDSGIEIVLPKPTKSSSLNRQMCGRATRPIDDIVGKLNTCPIPSLRRAIIAGSKKPVCTIIDIHGNFGRHRLSSPYDILGGNISEEVIQEATNAARKTGKPVRLDKSTEEEQLKLDQINSRKLAEEARKARLIIKSSYKSSTIDPFGILGIKPITNERGWEKGKQFTENQRTFLKNNNWDPSKLSYSQGKQIMDAMGKRRDKQLCTMKQAALLVKHKCNPDVTFEVAKSMIDQIAANGWHRPTMFNLPTKPLPPPKGKQVLPNGFTGDDVPF